MEDELKCSICKQFFSNPVLLPCSHSLCLNCAVNAQRTLPPGPAVGDEGPGGGAVGSSGATTAGSSSSGAGSDYPDGDKVSLLSETDSGVVVCNSRPSSYVGTPVVLLPPPAAAATATLSLTCPLCRKIVYFDENGANNLPKNNALFNIVERYAESKNVKVKCELCEGSPRDATVMCEQCAVYYCDGCRENCHPSRGPLAKHSLVSPHGGGAGGAAAGGPGARGVRSRAGGSTCLDHPDQPLCSFCLLCKLSVCDSCLLQDNTHASHELQPLTSICKNVKTELSQSLQTLSEKAKGATEYIHKLKGANEDINERCVEIEREIGAECERLKSVVEGRKLQLLEYVKGERDYRLRRLRDDVAASTARLHHTTGLLQFCIEALKETDPASFLQIGSGLINRVGSVDASWSREGTTTSSSNSCRGSSMPSSSMVAIVADFTLSLDSAPVQHAVEQLTFIQTKPPGAPLLISEECTTENNSATVVWQPHSSSIVDGYVLELDAATNGDYTEVYRGKETVCTVDGLHFNCIYNARVKAFNSTGEGPYSHTICLHTSQVAFFTLDPMSAHPDVILSNDNVTATCQSYEHRVVLGNIGFARGVHYWEVTIDRHDNCTDPAIGIARFDVAKDLMLGKDDKGWSMYIDHQRSWFMHFDKHHSRTEGGIGRGSVVGVLLDLDNHQLCFYVNDEMQGPIAFDGLYGVFYPAIGVNRNVQVTVQSALDPPCSSDHESDGAESGVGSATGATSATTVVVVNQ